MADTRNIVILGAAWGGLSAAHYFLKHIYPTLKRAQSSVTYKVVLVDPSTHFYYRIAAPRACVSTAEMPHNQSFTPIMDGFKQYDRDAVVFYHAEATALDLKRRTVTLRHAGSDSHEDTIPFYALVLSTGTKTPTPITSLQGDHTLTLNALDDMNRRLATATDIVISGGGPVAVETAGEIATHLNGPKGRDRKAKITIVTASTKLLPILRPKLAEKAEKLLNRVGVEVIYSTRVKKIDFSGDAGSSASGGVMNTSGKTAIHLDNGRTLMADVFIPATGVTPNTHFLPGNMLDAKGYIITNPTTLRVDDAGPRVYCIGDVGNYSRGGVLDLYDAMPVLGANMSNDLGVLSGVGAVDAGKPTDGRYSSESKAVANGAAEGKRRGDKVYKEDKSETQAVPIGKKTGVASFKGWAMPSMAVYFIKGKDYRIGSRTEITHGTKWIKA